MKKNDDTLPPADEIIPELKSLVADVEQMLTGPLTESSTAALADLRGRLAAAQDRLNVLYTGARKKVVAGAKYTDETIRANPYQSIAIAAGVGLLVGVLIGRRGDK